MNVITHNNKDGSWVCFEQGPLRPIVSESNTLDGAINNLDEIYGQQYAQAESLTALSLEIDLLQSWGERI
jgi:hypothetical protein